VAPTSAKAERSHDTEAMPMPSEAWSAGSAIEGLPNWKADTTPAPVTSTTAGQSVPVGRCAAPAARSESSDARDFMVIPPAQSLWRTSLWHGREFDEIG